MSDSSLSWLITCPLHVEKLLEQELRTLGFQHIKTSAGKVCLQGPLEAGYQVCLWSRLANRVLLQLDQWSIANGDDLYAAGRQFPWSDHLTVDRRFSISFHGTNRAIRHPHFGAQRLKDALVDDFRDRLGRRPNVDAETPQISFWAYLDQQLLTLYLDFSGESLHRRGYRQDQGIASLKENLAAALLWQCHWPRLARQGFVLLDPLCGSGTILAEGLLMRADWAPGLLRKNFGFDHWLSNQAQTWQLYRREAIERRAEGLENLTPVYGGDQSAQAIEQTQANLQRLGLLDYVKLKQQELALWNPPAPQGLLLTDPPYGERTGNDRDLPRLYRVLDQLRLQRFSAWEVALLLGDDSPWGELNIAANKHHPFRNGALACHLYRFLPKDVSQNAEKKTSPDLSPDSAFANRLQKNLRKLKPWLQQERVECFRLYDKDIPEYGVAVEVYGDQVQVQEYEPPKDVDLLAAERRLQEVLLAVPQVLGMEPAKVVLKQRRRQAGREQYAKLDNSQQRFEVQEGGLRFWVNLRDYLDTGLFLDHRKTRQWLRDRAEDKRFLNLFCYTASGTIYAAAGGARESVSVDLSKTYLRWAADNFRLNRLNLRRHALVEADCRAWIRTSQQVFDLIFLDPPTFSNSKAMKGTWDVQRDYVELLNQVSRLLAPEGVLLFSTNHRRFKLDPMGLPELSCQNLNDQLLPLDFARNPRIHQVWEIRHKNPDSTVRNQDGVN